MSSSKSGLPVYVCNVPNGKNEDRFSQRSLSLGGSDAIVVGVYDGHGGKECVEYVSKTLPQMVIQNCSKHPEITIAEQLTSSFVEADNSLIEQLRNSFKSYLTLPMPKVLRQKIMDTKLQKEESTEIALRARSGSTALLAVVEANVVTLANVGDCRAVLGRTPPSGQGIEAHRLTVDQNGDNEKERTRILGEHPESEAPTLFAGSRLFGHTAVTRSFGDVFYKEANTAYTEYVFGSSKITPRGQMPFSESMARFYTLLQTPPYLTAKPEVSQYQRSAHDRFLVMASDGVWGLKDITDELVVEKVAEGLEQGGDPSVYMMEEVKKFHPGDDVTIIVIVLSGAGVH